VLRLWQAIWSTHARATSRSASSSTSTGGAGLAPTAGQILLDVALKKRPPLALLGLLEDAL
jgi:hypothetical protein